MPDLSTPALRLAFVTPFANLHVLDPKLLCAVCEQESEWEPWAVRDEEAFFGRYEQPLVANHTVKTFTEARLRAMSFGLMQIMGQTARELGFAGVFLTQLCDPAIGAEYGCRKLRKCFDAHPDVQGALLSYNGGSNLAYPAQVLARVKNYG